MKARVRTSPNFVSIDLLTDKGLLYVAFVSHPVDLDDAEKKATQIVNAIENYDELLSALRHLCVIHSEAEWQKIAPITYREARSAIDKALGQQERNTPG